MNPCLVLDINILYVNIGPCPIDPAGAVPSMIEQVVVAPVEVQVQPASDSQPHAEGNERRNVGCLNVYDRRVVFRDINILGLGRDDLDIVPVDNDGLFSRYSPGSRAFALPT